MKFIRSLKAAFERLITTIENHTRAVEANTLKVSAVEDCAAEIKTLHGKLEQWRGELTQFKSLIDSEIQAKVQQYIKQGFDRWHADESTRQSDHALRKAR